MDGVPVEEQQQLNELFNAVPENDTKTDNGKKRRKRSWRKRRRTGSISPATENSTKENTNESNTSPSQKSATEGSSACTNHKAVQCTESVPHAFTELLAKLEETLTCSVCVDFFALPYTVECGHVFCLTCLHSWLSFTMKQNAAEANEDGDAFPKTGSCPLCRHEIYKEPAPCPFTIQNQIKLLHEFKYKDSKDSYEERVKKAEEFVQKNPNLFNFIQRRPLFVDDVERCPDCLTELMFDGQCPGCERFFHVSHDSDDDDSEEDFTNSGPYLENFVSDEASENSCVLMGADGIEVEIVSDDYGVGDVVDDDYLPPDEDDENLDRVLLDIGDDDDVQHPDYDMDDHGDLADFVLGDDDDIIYDTESNGSDNESITGNTQSDNQSEVSVHNSPTLRRRRAIVHSDSDSE
jgi:hypothetical protein